MIKLIASDIDGTLVKDGTLAIDRVCKKKIVYFNRKSDRGRRFTEVFHQSIVTTALDHWLAGSIGVCLENDSRVVLIFAEHSEVKRDVFLVAVVLHDLIDFFESGNCFECACIVCQASGFL